MIRRVALSNAWLSRQLLTLCAIALSADVVLGLLLPLFPPLARELGASLLLVGALTALSSGTQVLSGVPLGILSDRWGRGRVIALGAGAIALASGLLSVARSPMWLAVAQILVGFGIVATFVMGAALVGDLSAPASRGRSMGLYTTSMGAGFALGPLLGGVAGELGGPRLGLQIAALLALASAVAALIWLPRGRGSVGQALPRRALPVLASNRALQLACASNLLFSPIFNALVVSFVALRGEALGFGTLAVSGLFTIRALVSTSLRLPVGAACTPIWSRRLMLLALGLGGVAALGLASSGSYLWFAAALALEGISYGVFLTAGQAFVTHHVERENLGAAMGAYSTVGGISGAISPLIVGAVAGAFGMPAAFELVGALALVGAAVLAALLLFHANENARIAKTETGFSDTNSSPR